MQIKVELFQAWGMDLYRPRCEASKIFAKLVGRDNLTTANLRLIKDLGYSIEAVAKEVKL